jgi:hypothetical protein
MIISFLFLQKIHTSWGFRPCLLHTNCITFLRHCPEFCLIYSRLLLRNHKSTTITPIHFWKMYILCIYHRANESHCSNYPLIHHFYQFWYLPALCNRHLHMYIFFLSFWRCWVWTQDFCILLGRHSTPWSTHQPHRYIFRHAWFNF